MSNFLFARKIPFILIFFAVILLSLVFASWVSNKINGVYNSNFQNVRSLESGLSQANDLKTIFIGDSRTHQGVDVKRYLHDLSAEPSDALNIGRPGMPSSVMYILIKRAIERNPDMKLIFANLSFYLRVDDRKWFDSIYLSYLKPSLEELVIMHNSGLLSVDECVSWYVKTRVPLLRNKEFSARFIRNVFVNNDRVLKEVERIRTLTEQLDDETNRGYLSRGAGYLKTHEEATKFGYRSEYHGKTDEYFLKKIFELVNKHRINLVVYEFPWPQERRSQTFGGKPFSDIIDFHQERLRKLADKNNYVHVLKQYNYWPRTWFIDSQHLNQFGAERLASYLAWITPKYMDRAPEFCFTANCN